MKKLGLLPLFAIVLTLVCPEVFGSVLPFSATADDGLVLKGTLYMPDGAKESPPVIILLPMMANDRSSWGEFPKKLMVAGYAVLALDQRGHGESVWKGKKKVSYTQFSNSEFAKMVTDLDAVMENLYRQRVLDTSRVAIFGASIGANVALVYASKHSNVKPVVLLSPGLDYRGLATEDAAASYGKRPALIVVSKGDGYAALSSQQLAEKIGASATLKIYEGSQHGTRLFAEQKEFAPFLFGWITANFPVATAPQK